MSWTQPQCDKCWMLENPAREAVRLTMPTLEQCCTCGFATRSGIYIRRDPATVAYPTMDEDDDFTRAERLIERLLGGTKLDD